MREDKQENIPPWVEEETPRQFEAKTPLMLDKATDTSLDGESFKLVPCTCRISDLDLSTNDSLKQFRYKPTDTLRECSCAEERKLTLLDAVFTGNSELLGICLDHGVDLNSTDESGNTVLHLASNSGDVDMLSLLLKLRKVDVDTQNTLGHTALALAVIHSRNEAVQLLLNHGADPNIPDMNGRTPIFFSVQAGDEKITKKLLEYDADVNVVDAFGCTPLQISLTDNPIITMVKVLLSSGANPVQKTTRLNPFLETVLACTTYEKLEYVKVLVDYGVDVNVLDPKSRRNCLHLVAINGFLPLAEYLVNAGASLEQLDMSDRQPDLVARQHNNLKVADFFLKAKCLRRIFFKNQVKGLSRLRRKLTLTSMFGSFGSIFNAN